MKHSFWVLGLVIGLPFLYSAKDTTNPKLAVKTIKLSKPVLKAENQIQEQKALDSENRFKQLARKAFPDKFKNAK